MEEGSDSRRTDESEVLYSGTINNILYETRSLMYTTTPGKKNAEGHGQQQEKEKEEHAMQTRMVTWYGHHQEDLSRLIAP